MTALSVQPAYPIFTERDGQPLEDGYIWIGAANQDPQTNPISVFWDIGLTIPAAQPIRTLNGYPSRAGTPARLYVNTDYSIRVMDKKGAVVYTAPAATERYSEVVLEIPPVTAADVSFTGFKGQTGDVQDLATDDGSDWIGYKRQNVNTTAVSVEDRLNEPYISVTEFGAVGDDSTACDTAVAFAFQAALQSGKPLYFPEGTYRFTTTGQTEWDLTGYERKGMKIFGAGNGRTILNFANASGPIGLYIHATTDWYDFMMSDLQIKGTLAGPLLVIGRNDYADPANVLNLTNVIVLNSLNSNAAEGMRLNYVVNSNFIGCRANCYADGLGNNAGTALRARQVEFCTFTNGSYGNAEYGVRFMDGFSFANVFVGTDHENVNYCASCDTNNSGNNTFIGGQWSLWTVAALKRTGSLSTNAMTLINPNFSNGASLAPVIDPVNFGKIRIIDGRPIGSPSMPPSGNTVANITGKKVLVVIWGGTVTQVTIDGFGIGITGGAVMVEHGQAISVTYTAAPQWTWQPLE